jgi:hypothetical protein
VSFTQWEGDKEVAKDSLEGTDKKEPHWKQVRSKQEMQVSGVRGVRTNWGTH